MSTWTVSAPGVVQLPSGRLVRGRSLRRPSEEQAELTIALLGRRPGDDLVRWVRWPDFGLPADPADAREAFLEAWCRAEHERVEVACGGGRGRTGTALACIAILDGVAARDAVTFVRRQYDPRAVETPWQRRFVRRFRL